MSDAGKGPKDNRTPDFKARGECPLWDNIGPEAREKRRIKAADDSELHEQIENARIVYEEYEA